MFKAKDYFGKELIIPDDKLNMDNISIEIGRDDDNDVEFDIVFNEKYYYFFTSDTNNIWFEERWEKYAKDQKSRRHR